MNKRIVRYLYKAFCFLVIFFSIAVSLEAALWLVDRYGIFNLTARKQWFSFSEPFKRALVCYPSNPSGYFSIDLRKPDVRDKYDIKDRSWKETPFCVDERYNSLGYREKEISLKGNKQTVFFIGDSFVLGEGVSAEDRFTGILQNKYGQNGPDVYNLGLCGANVETVYEKSFKEALKFSPDMILYCYNLNDPVLCGEIADRQKNINDLMNIRYYNTDLCKFFEEKAYEKKPLFLKECYKTEKRLVLNSKLIFILRRLFIDRLVTRETIKWYKDMYTSKNEGWKKTKKLLLEMKNECESKNISFGIVILPIFYDFYHYPFRDIHKELYRFCYEKNIKVTDTLPYFESKDYRDLIVHPLDYHPNKKAHSLIAGEIDFFYQKQLRKKIFYENR